MVKRGGAFGGSGGPGFMLGAGVGSFMTCKSDDDSWFCKLTKFVSVIQMILFLISIVVIIYMLFNYYVLKR